MDRRGIITFAACHDVGRLCGVCDFNIGRNMIVSAIDLKRRNEFIINFALNEYSRFQHFEITPVDSAGRERT
jgi:hypothetical protein